MLLVLSLITINQEGRIPLRLLSYFTLYQIKKPTSSRLPNFGMKKIDKLHLSLLETSSIGGIP